MTREKMIDAISDAVRSVNYTLYTGVEQRINDSVKIMPATWLNPPKLIKIEGHKNGTVTYAVVMQMMASGKRLSENQKLGVWSRLEQDAIKIYRTLAAHENIIAATDLQCAPDEFSLSNHGELSMAMKFNLQIKFCS